MAELSRRTFLQTTGMSGRATRLLGTGPAEAGHALGQAQETMVSPPVRLPVPLLFNLYTNPREDEDKPALDTWVIGPVLKIVAAFEESVKKYPLIPTGMPDPYRPPAGSR
jgi:hypothetical protein